MKKNMAAPTLDYEMKQIDLRVGDEHFKIECVKDLNKTIDDLFAKLEKEGDASLLEELCPYFGVVWPSAKGLSEHIASLFPVRFEDLRILEVGCGLAIPSLFCARKGAQVTATDFHPEVPRFLEKNIEINQIKNLNFERLDWAKPASTGQIKYDWVIGSDVLYESQHPKPVAQALASHVKSDGKIMLADPARPYLQAFSDAMKELGFREEMKTVRVPDNVGMKDIFVLSFSQE